MSDTFTHDDDDQDLDAIQTQGFRDEIKEARRIKRENAEMKAQLEATRLEAAGIKAGLPDTPAARFFLENYKGPADSDSIRAQAQELGFLTPAPAPQADPAVEAELARLRTTQGAVGEGQEPEPEAVQTYYDRLAAARKAFKPGQPGSGDAAKDLVIDAIEDAQRGGIDIHLVDGARGY